MIFDTVNAGSTAWPFEEWKRLVNVGLSRAREFVILLASRAEMQEPYLRSLVLDLSPQVLKWSGSKRLYGANRLENPGIKVLLPGAAME